MSETSSRRPTRRDFLRRSGAVGGALAAPTIIPSSVLGRTAVPPSERIVMGGIGLGCQGGNDFGAFLGNKEVQYVAVCDVRKNVRDGWKKRVDGAYRSKDCAACNDFRELLARDDIDAVHIATPDHWHAIMIIEACRHGKDVFCQKPESLTLAEGPLMVAAARRYGRVVSGGSQRVAQDYRHVVSRCWGGEIGPVKSINVGIRNVSQPCNLPPEPVPEGFDWDMWLGPAPWAPYNGRRCAGDFNTFKNAWRAYLDYSGGDMTDWGAHHFGGATFAVDVRELQPREVIYHEQPRGIGFLEFIYPNGLVLTVNRPGKGNMEVELAGGGSVTRSGQVKRPGKGDMEVEDPPGGKREPKEIPGYKAKGGITHDFLHCVRTREKPFRDIEIAVNTMAVCHLGTVACRLKRSLKWDAAECRFIGDEEANRHVDRARREPWQL